MGAPRSTACHILNLDPILFTIYSPETCPRPQASSHRDRLLWAPPLLGPGPALHPWRPLSVGAVLAISWVLMSWAELPTVPGPGCPEHAAASMCTNGQGVTWVFPHVQALQGACGTWAFPL